MEFSGYVPPDGFWAINDRLDQQVRNVDGAAVHGSALPTRNQIGVTHSEW